MRKKPEGLTFYEKKKILSRELVSEILSWAFYTIVAIAVAWLLVVAFGHSIRMVGSAMRPQIENGDKLLLDRVTYRVSSVSRGDVIAFYPNGNTGTRLMVRRVIGIPGDTVKIVDGIVYINDKQESDPEHRYALIADPGIAASGITLEEKEYFVLGDMRNGSEDSRSADIGSITYDSIVGKVWHTFRKES